MKFSNIFRLVVAALSVMLLALLPGCSTAAKFDSAADAGEALVEALRADDQARVETILGKGAEDLLSSGDGVADRNRVAAFLTAWDQKHTFELERDGRVTVVVGDEEWPLPIPVVKERFGDRWSFDLKAGKDEVLNRRIGRNEIDAIQSCLAIVDAQREYAAADPDKAGKGVYAQKFLSDAGKKNGLYWPTKEGETPSPLGELVTAAAAEGYRVTQGRPTPYHGYCFRILTSQGSFAPGGKMDYMVNGKMSGGFAVVAWPAAYGESGIETFIVSHGGLVYSANLGRDTEKKALAMTAFDPDDKWWPVEDAGVIIAQQ